MAKRIADCVLGPSCEARKAYIAARQPFGTDSKFRNLDFSHSQLERQIIHETKIGGSELVRGYKIFQVSVSGIALTSDGKILGVGSYAADSSQLYLARFNSDTTEDTTFGTLLAGPTGGQFYGRIYGNALNSAGIYGESYPVADSIGESAGGEYFINFGDKSIHLDTNGVIQPPAPNDPTSLEVTVASATEVHLQFTDNAVNETGFVIERSDSIPYWHTDTIAPSIGTGTVSFDDTTLSRSTTYVYRVFAINGGLRSGNSFTVSVTTPA